MDLFLLFFSSGPICTDLLVDLSLSGVCVLQNPENPPTPSPPSYVLVLFSMQTYQPDYVNISMTMYIDP